MIRPNGCLATLFLLPWIALRAARARLQGGRGPDRLTAPGCHHASIETDTVRRGPTNAP